MIALFQHLSHKIMKYKEFHEYAKIVLAQSLHAKAKNEHKGTKAEENEANHLSTGACTHIKRKKATVLQRLPHEHGVGPARLRGVKQAACEVWLLNN